MSSKQKDNYLERVYERSEKYTWTKDDSGNVTIEVENRGFFNKVMQLLLKKPKTSYVHLDELGSFVWQSIDGKRSIFEIGQLVAEHFGESANPLYERLVEFFSMLERGSFIKEAKK